ncbi:MAG: carbohydrate porin [Pseudomonadales bacterium]
MRNGLQLDMVYTGEWAQVQGGIEDGNTYLDNVDLILEGDLEQLWGWQNSTFRLYVLGNQGGSPSSYAGDLQTVSNIDAPDTWKLYEIWYQRSWRAGAHSLRVGLYDFNSEFDVLATAGLFINSSFGIGAEIAQSGENGPSIFPTTSLALRMAVSNEAGYYAQAVVMDGVPGDPEQPHGTHVRLDGDDGLMLAAEVGHLDSTSKLALGSWRYTRDVKRDASEEVIRAEDNWGIYALGESDLYSEQDPAQGLAGFLRYGVAEQSINQLQNYVGLGLVYTGLFAHRDQDQFGLAAASAGLSRAYRRQQQALGETPAKRETTIELTYRAQITSWLALQPSYQYVVDPGGLETINNASVFLLRFELGL